MKKTFLSIAMFLLISPAIAADNPCVIKQKNAASFTFAQELGVAVQDVEVIDFEYGMWTEAIGDNTGSDKVTVRIGRKKIKYKVDAEQIGRTDDCTILTVTEVLK